MSFLTSSRRSAQAISGGDSYRVISGASRSGSNIAPGEGGGSLQCYMVKSYYTPFATVQ